MSRLGRRQSDASDSVSQGSDREESKVALTKRRRTETAFVPTFKQDLESDDDDDDDDDENESDLDSLADGKVQSEKGKTGAIATTNPEDDVHPSRRDRKAPVKALTRDELEAVNEARARSGVVYLSKVPPFMKPQKVKHLLSAYGETNRIFLAPEDPKSYAKRVRFGGNKRRMFTEGWIEFTDKRKAKLVAETLNTEKIGGKKGSFYHDDLWNLKYLHKFKWDDLTAQIAAENASRQVRLANEIEQGKKEARHYLKNAERAKMISKIQATRAAKTQQQDGGLADDGQHGGSGEGAGGGDVRMRRRFNQRDVKDKTQPIVQGGGGKDGADDRKMKQVMASIFG